MSRNVLKVTMLMLAVMLILNSCSTGADKADIRFYVLKNDLINDQMTERQIVNAAKMSGRLAFDGNDIEGYYWADHCITLKRDAVKSRAEVTAESGGSALFKTTDEDYFVLTVKDEIIYWGGFEHGIANPQVPVQPSICDVDSYSFKITYNSKYATGNDPRSSKKMYACLDRLGILSSKSE